MRNRKPLLMFGVVVLSAAVLFGMQEKKKAPAKPPMDEKAMMEMMQKYGTPGQGHKKLDFMAGSWTTKNSMWMDPAQPPEVTEGASEHRWILGGRYLEQRFSGNFMNTPFTGLGYTGYDNYKRQYVGTWMDTMGTCMLNMTGNFDKSGKILTMTGKMDDPMLKKEVTLREKMTIINNDEMLFEMFGPGMDGKEYRMMEMRYTRKR